MRLRLGLLRDTAAIDRQVAKEAAEAQAKKHKHEAPTVKTEAQTRADDAVARDKDKSAQPAKTSAKPRIRPLTEAKAIDTGANFISETFLFFVGGGLIVFESLRSRRKESTRREDVAGRLGELEESERNARRALVALEKEILRLRAAEKKEASSQVPRILPKEVLELEQKEEAEDEQKAKDWLSWLKSFGRDDGNRTTTAGSIPLPDEKHVAGPTQPSKSLTDDPPPSRPIQI